MNLARFVFLDQQSRTFYKDWEGIADSGVGNLRAEAGRDLYDPDLTDLVGELSMRSEDFRARRAFHDVRQDRSGTRPFHHPLVGDLTLSYEALQLTADIGMTLIAYTAELASRHSKHTTVRRTGRRRRTRHRVDYPVHRGWLRRVRSPVPRLSRA